MMYRKNADTYKFPIVNNPLTRKEMEKRLELEQQQKEEEDSKLFKRGVAFYGIVQKDVELSYFGSKLSPKRKNKPFYSNEEWEAIRLRKLDRARKRIRKEKRKHQQGGKAA